MTQTPVKQFLVLLCCMSILPVLTTPGDLADTVDLAPCSHRGVHHTQNSHHQISARMSEQSSLPEPGFDNVALRILKFCNDSITTEREHTTLKLMRVIDGYQTTTRILSDRIAKLEAISVNNDDILERVNAVLTLLLQP